MNQLLRRSLVLGVPVGLVVLACSGPDPSELTCKDRLSGEVRPCDDAGRAIASSSSSTSSTSSTSGSTSSGDGGSGSGSGSGGLDTNPFRDPMFKGTSPTVTAQQSHTVGGGPMISRTQACLGCHAVGGNRPAFIAAGIVYTNNTASQGAGNAEIWLWNPNTKQSSKVNSDSTGAFWFPASGPPVTAPFKMGVRDNNGNMKVMADPNTGDCQTSMCHGQTTPGIFLQ